MKSTREWKKQHDDKVTPLKSHQNSHKHNVNPCGSCNSCHQMSRIQLKGNSPIWGGNDDGTPGQNPPKPCAINFLQRNLGNSYMQSIAGGGQAPGQITTKNSAPKIQRKCSCGGTCSKEDEDKRIQAKLKIGPANDVYEQEADKVAEQVMRMPEPVVQPENDQSLGLHIQRISSGNKTGFDGDINLNQNGGRPISTYTRKYMEPRFGVDFGQVRLHTDEQARESASQIQARAFTYGNNIWLGEGANESDKGLMAHELTHVVQQTSGTARSITTLMEISDPFDASEWEADAVADRITRGGSVEAGASNIVQRLGDLTKVPAGLGCPIAASTSVAPVTNVFTFAQGSFALSAVQINDLENFVRIWHDAGASDLIRIDGFASTEGTDEFNWTLSCQRAEAVLAELTSPSSMTTPGIPAGLIEELAQGETDEFGTTLPPNRRAQITTMLVIPPVSLVAPACPGGSASTRMTATIIPVRVARDDGSNPTVLPSFARFDIWRRCCVDFTIAAPVTINSTALQIVDDSGGAPTAEEQALIAAAPGGTQINVIIVRNFDTGGGVLNPDSGGGALTDPGTGAAHETVIAVEGTVSEVIAHEVGHAIGASHTCPNTIMCGTDAHDVPNPQHVNAGICAAARTGAVLTASATVCCLNQT